MKLTGSIHLQNPPRIVIGSDYENPVYLNRNDAGGARGIWTQEEIFGFWRVKIKQGNYNIRYKFITPVNSTGTMILETNSLIYRQENNNPPSDIVEMKNVYIPATECDLIPYYLTQAKSIFPLWVELERIVPVQ